MEVDVIDIFVEEANDLRTRALNQKESCLDAVRVSPLETKTVQKIEIRGPFEHVSEQTVLCDAKKKEDLDAINKLQDSVSELISDAKKISETSDVLKDLGIENPRVVSHRDMQAIKDADIVHIDENPEISEGKLWYLMPPLVSFNHRDYKLNTYLGDRIYWVGASSFAYTIKNEPCPAELLGFDSNKKPTLVSGQRVDSFYEEDRGAIVHIKNPKFSTSPFKGLVEIGKSFKDYRLKPVRLGFKLPRAPKYMIDAHASFEEVIRRHYLRERSSLLKKRTFFETLFFKNVVVKDRFKIFYMIDYSIFDDQLYDLYQGAGGVNFVPYKDPIIGIKDIKNQTYHIGPAYGGASLLGEKKCLYMLKKIYLT
jgi:hypothetical protein